MERTLLALLLVIVAFAIVAEGFNKYQPQYCPYGQWPRGYCYSSWDCYYGSYCFRGYGYGYGSGVCCPTGKGGGYY
ncbi:keratin-associated protein 21-2-like [Crassostrea angulata]|uniref:keratin-associated protein 21-2-like n=1 Tax=Magallana angulata TaxID=2784310 RepID=UPI0022B132E9|nr:keratin-associated protein 21-2-like [Crassostrea angulata]